MKMKQSAYESIAICTVINSFWSISLEHNCSVCQFSGHQIFRKIGWRLRCCTGTAADWFRDHGSANYPRTSFTISSFHKHFWLLYWCILARSCPTDVFSDSIVIHSKVLKKNINSKNLQKTSKYLLLQACFRKLNCIFLQFKKYFFEKN